MRNSFIFIPENAFENVVWKMAAICLGLNVLMNGKHYEDSSCLVSGSEVCRIVGTW